MNNDWILELKVTDKNARSRRKKSVLLNIHLELPTNMMSAGCIYALDELKKVVSIALLK